MSNQAASWDVYSEGLSLDTFGLVGTDFNLATLSVSTIDGTSLNTFGFLWDTANIWLPLDHDLTSSGWTLFDASITTTWTKSTTLIPF